MRLLLLSYNGTTDPLLHTQLLAYVRDLPRQNIGVHLMTYERCHDTRVEERAWRARLRVELAREGIVWHPLRYHKWPPILSTWYDLAVGIVVAWWLVWRQRITLLHARGTIPAVIAAPIALASGRPWLLDLRGLVSEEYADGGLWRRGSWIHRLTKRVERRLIRRADGVVVLTHRAAALLMGEGLRRILPRVIPCCVDVDRFAQASARRNGTPEALVLAYIGSLGTWYLFDEMAQFVLAVAAHRPQSRFLVVSPPRHHAQAWEAVRRFPGLEARTNVVSASPEAIPEQLASAHAGLAFIQASFSKQFSSPTKIGEYLAAGIPVVVNHGVGDVDDFVTQHRVGVVLPDCSPDSYARGAAALLVLLEDAELTLRCRRAAREELSLDMGRQRYRELYGQLTRPHEAAK